MLALCSHSGSHTAAARFHRDFGYLRFVLVCDDCGDERADLGTETYRPRARPHRDSLAERMARELALPRTEVERLALAALLRDVGKEQLPPGVLAKPGPLTAAEWAEVRRHPELSAALLGGPAFADVRAWILHHHERWDGAGYPDGLEGGAIPLEARVLAVIDAYEGMTSDRPYAPTLSHDAAVRELWREVGERFDVAVVAAFQRASARTAGARAAA
ncbi:MAG: HD domain-containing protein [Actinomycetota bacterium]|nr:HD domain-containing protein [Actinomycetota bacterium]